jgi:hypothetical protein
LCLRLLDRDRLADGLLSRGSVLAGAPLAAMGRQTASYSGTMRLTLKRCSAVPRTASCAYWRSSYASP